LKTGTHTNAVLAGARDQTHNCVKTTTSRMKKDTFSTQRKPLLLL